MRIVKAALLLTVIVTPHTALACGETGERTQRVYAASGGVDLKAWVVSSSKIETVEMPNGFKLGVSIEPADAAKYNSMQSGYAPELVQITLFDVAADGNPRKLASTWGGANSVQGYGAQGGADRIAQLGNEGVTLTLLRPVCVPARTVAQAQ